MQQGVTLIKVALFLLSLAVTPLVIAETLIDADPVVELETALAEQRQRKDGPKAADRLFSSEEWALRMSVLISSLLTDARISDDEFNAFYRANPRVLGLDEKNSPFGPPRPGDHEVGAKIGRASEARRTIVSLFRLIFALRDPRVVPLITPALNETTPAIHYHDYSIDGPQNSAATNLKYLADQGVIAAHGLSSGDVEGWRKWWSENKTQFGPVPAALRELGEAQAGNASAPPKIAPKQSPGEALTRSAESGGSPRSRSFDLWPWALVVIGTAVAALLFRKKLRS